MTKTRVGVLISGRGSNLPALIGAQGPYCPYEIVVVASNKPDAPGLQRARYAGIDTVALDHRPFGKDRAAFEYALDAQLRTRGVEIIALAGFMRVFTPFFVGAWAQRMLNVHPALLPSYVGLDTHARAIADGAKLHGCTVHWVTEGLDAGPIIGQAAVPILPGDTPEMLAIRVLAAEDVLYPACLALACEGGGTGPALPAAREIFLNAWLA